MDHAISPETSGKSRSTWRKMSKKHKHWLASIEPEQFNSDEPANRLDIEQSNRMVRYVISTLSSTPDRAMSDASGFAVIRKVASTVMEAVSEDILTESEASALMEFVATKFVERRFDAEFNRVFQLGEPHSYKFRYMKGQAK